MSKNKNHSGPGYLNYTVNTESALTVPFYPLMYGWYSVLKMSIEEYSFLSTYTWVIFPSLWERCKSNLPFAFYNRTRNQTLK